MGDRGIQQVVSRRQALQLGAAGLICASPLPALGAKTEAGERVLKFCHMHTGERLSTAYWVEGNYVVDSLLEVNHILRDHRTGEKVVIDPRLLDLLHTLQSRIETNEPIEVFSAYRSPKTNATLRRRSRGVARRSYHLFGKAVDIRIPGVKPSQLVRLARSLEKGGVGFYRRRPFVHIDTGPVRYWRG